MAEDKEYCIRIAPEAGGLPMKGIGESLSKLTEDKNEPLEFWCGDFVDHMFNGKPGDYKFLSNLGPTELAERLKPRLPKDCLQWVTLDGPYGPNGPSNPDFKSQPLGDNG